MKKRMMKKMKVLLCSALVAEAVLAPMSSQKAFAVSNSTKDNPAYFNDENKSYMYNDIYLGQGMSFEVKGSTWFKQKGKKKNTEIYNKTSVKITGIGCSISGLEFSQGDSETYDTIKNTKGQTFAGISGTVATDQVWYFNIVGTSSGYVKYDGTKRNSSATVTKWV